MFVTETLLAQLPSSPLPGLPARSLPKKLWLFKDYWVTVGRHCLPWASEKRSLRPPSQVLIWCNGPLIAFYPLKESALCCLSGQSSTWRNVKLTWYTAAWFCLGLHSLTCSWFCSYTILRVGVPIGRNCALRPNLIPALWRSPDGYGLEV